MTLATLQMYDSTDGNISVNLDHLTPEKQIDLHVLLTEVKGAIRRVESEFLFMATKLGMMQEILGEEAFYPFVAANLKLPKYQINRLLLANRAIQNHLTDDEGRVEVAMAGRFTQRALFMLAPVEDEGILNEVRSLASAGEKINEATLARVIEAHQSNNDARLAVAESAAEKAEAALAKVKEVHELEMLRLTKQMASTNEQMRKLGEQRAAAEEEIAALMKKATIVTEKVVEKVPDGFTSVEEAIHEATQRLEAVQKQEQDAIAAAEAAQAQLINISADVQAKVASSAEFTELRSVVNQLLLQFPLAKIKGVASANDEQRLAIIGMGNAMVDLGKQLLEATQKAA